MIARTIRARASPGSVIWALSEIEKCGSVSPHRDFHHCLLAEDPAPLVNSEAQPQELTLQGSTATPRPRDRDLALQGPPRQTPRPDIRGRVRGRA